MWNHEINKTLQHQGHWDSSYSERTPTGRQHVQVHNRSETIANVRHSSYRAAARVRQQRWWENNRWNNSYSKTTTTVKTTTRRQNLHWHSNYRETTATVRQQWDNNCSDTTTIVRQQLHWDSSFISWVVIVLLDRPLTADITYCTFK